MTEFTNIQDQIQQNQNLVNVTKALAAVEVTINKISLDDPRKNQLEKQRNGKIESEVTDLNKEIEANNNKLNNTLSSITSLQNGV